MQRAYLPAPIRRASSSSAITPYAITYSPYTDSGACKDYEAVELDIAAIAKKNIGTVRIYSTDCNGLVNVGTAAKKWGMGIIAGIWISSAGIDSADTDVDAFVAWGKDDDNFDLIDMLIVGNEAVLNGWVTASDLINKVTSVRATVRDAGFTGRITTAETSGTFIANPALCTSSSLDVVAINAHSYFDIYSTPATAGTFVLSQISITEAACGGKAVVVTETGFPHAGNTNGGNVPSVANQKIAVNAILTATEGDVVLFTTYDDYWKSPGPYNIEQSWGLLSNLDS
ncbi:to Saccharomyces cerevisiae scw11 (YGL028C) [Saitoella coloradoensis]